MRRTRIGIFAAGFAALVTAAPPALAGVVIVTESEEAKEAAGQGKPARGATKIDGRLFVQGDDVRMEGSHSDREGTAKGALLFRAASDTLVVLDDNERSYFEMTRADAKRLASTIDTARSQMQAQLDKLPPEQRAMLEQAMGGLGGAPADTASKPEPLRAVPTGRSDEVAGRACREFDLLQGKKSVGRACVATWDALGLAPGDLAGLRKLAAFQRELAEQARLPGVEAAPGSEVFELMDAVGGFPVRVRTTHEGEPVVMRVVDIERRQLDPKTFQVPAGYARGKMPG
jgi:hypothetical protein